MFDTIRDVQFVVLYCPQLGLMCIFTVVYYGGSDEILMTNIATITTSNRLH